jgi:hypothetical protein
MSRVKIDEAVQEFRNFKVVFMKTEAFFARVGNLSASIEAFSGVMSVPVAKESGLFSPELDRIDDMCGSISQKIRSGWASQQKKTKKAEKKFQVLRNFVQKVSNIFKSTKSESQCWIKLMGELAIVFQDPSVHSLLDSGAIFQQQFSCTVIDLLQTLTLNTQQYFQQLLEGTEKALAEAFFVPETSGKGIGFLSSKSRLSFRETMEKKKAFFKTEVQPLQLPKTPLKTPTKILIHDLLSDNKRTGQKLFSKSPSLMTKTPNFDPSEDSIVRNIPLPLITNIPNTLLADSSDFFSSPEPFKRRIYKSPDFNGKENDRPHIASNSFRFFGEGGIDPILHPLTSRNSFRGDLITSRSVATKKLFSSKDCEPANHP